MGCIQTKESTSKPVTNDIATAPMETTTGRRDEEIPPPDDSKKDPIPSGSGNVVGSPTSVVVEEGRGTAPSLPPPSASSGGAEQPRNVHKLATMTESAVRSQSQFVSMPDFRARTSSYVIDKKRNACESFTPVGAIDTVIRDVTMYGSLVTVLPRGGVAVHTSIGGIQFGAPPETIKDSLCKGLDVPTYYVVHGTMFSRRKGICTAELEFPAYYNYFIRKKKITIITTPDLEERIRTIFLETLLGPTEIDMSQDFSYTVDKSAWPDVKREAEWLDAARKSMKIDSLLTFIHFKSGVEGTGTLEAIIQGAGEASGNNVSITYSPLIDCYSVRNFGLVDNFGDVGDLLIPKDTLHHFNDKRFENLSWGVFEENIDHTVRLNGPTGLAQLFVNSYEVPQFGVTMLGASHGFDSDGTTTGFILWIRKRGILIDPPPHGIDLLARNGVSHKLIDGIILTHCHGDHDAGTFRSLFFDRGLTLYTTKTIFHSFQRKYSAVSGFSVAFLTELIKFQPVKVGESLCVNGGIIDFFYSLHTIPCIGIKAKCGGKTFTYSADTHMNPELVQKMFNDGAIGEGRKDALLNFPWDADLILHEAGVPPIHTPIDILSALSPEIKSRLYLVHVTPRTVPEKSGLQVASAGQTLRLDVVESEHQAAVQALNLFRRISILSPLFTPGTLDNAIQILQGAKIDRYDPGSVIVSKSSTKQKFCVIMKGVVSIEIENGKGVPLKKFYTTGDFFGESLIEPPGKTSVAVEIIAQGQVEIVSLDKILFIDLIHNTDVAGTMKRLAERRFDSWFAVEECKAISEMTIAEKTHLESLFTYCVYPVDTVLWKFGEPAEKCVLILEGEFIVSANRGDKKVEEIVGVVKRGAFVGDINAIMSKGNSQINLRSSSSGTFRCLEISRSNLVNFFRMYPGALVNFKDQHWVL